MPIAGRRAAPIVTAAMRCSCAALPQAARRTPTRPTSGARRAPTMPRAGAVPGIRPPAPAISCSRPYSIGTAMAMALAGARGETEREMVAVLQHSLARAQIDDANAPAIAILNGYDKSDIAAELSAGHAARRASAARRSPTREGMLPVPGEPERRHLRGEPALSAVGQAPGRQCADDRRRRVSPRTMRRCSRTATRRRCSSAPASTPSTAGSGSAPKARSSDPREDVRRRPGQRGLFQVALGASPSTRSSPGPSSSA